MSLSSSLPIWARVRRASSIFHSQNQLLYASRNICTLIPKFETVPLIFKQVIYQPEIAPARLFSFERSLLLTILADGTETEVGMVGEA